MIQLGEFRRKEDEQVRGRPDRQSSAILFLFVLSGGGRIRVTDSCIALVCFGGLVPPFFTNWRLMIGLSRSPQWSLSSMATVIGGGHPIIGRTEYDSAADLEHFWQCRAIALRLHDMGKSFATRGMNKSVAPRSMSVGQLTTR